MYSQYAQPPGGRPAYNPASGAYNPQQQPPQSMSTPGAYDTPAQHVGGGAPPPVHIFNPAQVRRQAPTSDGAVYSAGPSSQAGGMHESPGPQPLGGRGGGPYGGQQQMNAGNYGQGMGAPHGMMQQPRQGTGDVGFDAFQAAANSQAFQMGVGMSQEYLNANMKRYIPWFTSAWHALKYYFAVNHHYVQRKLLLLLFPFTKKQWTREVLDDAAGQHDGGYGAAKKFQVPMMDENAPDLYIPLMALITYILVTGYAKGTANSFTPEVLVEVTTACFVTQMLEIAIIRLGLYLLNAPGSFLDLLAITGYKYVPLNINMLCGLAFGRSAYFFALLYTGIAITYFSLKTFAHAVKRGIGRGAGGAHIQIEFVVLGFSVLQAVSVWWLGYSSSLAKKS